MPIQPCGFDRGGLRRANVKCHIVSKLRKLILIAPALQLNLDPFDLRQPSPQFGKERRMEDEFLIVKRLTLSAIPQLRCRQGRSSLMKLDHEVKCLKQRQAANVAHKHDAPRGRHTYRSLENPHEVIN